MTPADSAGRDETRAGPGLAPAGREDPLRSKPGDPRAAGTASTRGAQPPGQRAITICCYCRKRICRQRNGEWYHRHNASTSCRPGEGSERRATPVEIEAR